jgi:hypothetical protein
MADEEVEVFIVHWACPTEDATTMVLCEYCGTERYTSPENLRAARARKMQPICVGCCTALFEKEEGIVGGTVRHGRVIEKR